MRNINFSKLGLETLNTQDAKTINGGNFWSKLGGWVTVAISEITDVITSGGKNLVDAYNNGREAAETLY